MKEYDRVECIVEKERYDFEDSTTDATLKGGLLGAVIGLLGLSPQSPSGSAELAPLGQSSPFFLRLPCDFTAR